MTADPRTAAGADPATEAVCAVAHGDAPAPRQTRTLVAVFAAPVAGYLLRYAEDLGYRPVLFEPDAERAAAAGLPGGVRVCTRVPELDDTADVVVTDHHRPDLGTALRELLTQPARWIGVLGNPRHPGPHVELLRELGVARTEIDRVHRPVGLNIGSRTPAEIAVATLAGLIADRNDRPGGFDFG